MAQQVTLNAMKQLTLAEQDYRIALNAYSTWTGNEQLPKTFAEHEQSLPLAEHPDIAFLQSLQSIEAEKLQLTKYSQNKTQIFIWAPKQKKATKCRTTLC